MSHLVVNDGEDLITRRSPERRMLCALLCRAILDLDAKHEGKRIWRRDVIAWMNAGQPIETNEHGYTFYEVCESLDLDPRVVLGKLKKQGLFDGESPEAFKELRLMQTTKR